MNEKRRQSFRVTHLFSLHSAETKPRRGAVPGPSPGPMAGGTAPVLTLTTVPSVLLNPATRLVTTKCVTSACVDLSQDQAPRCALAAAEIPLCTPLLSASAWARRGVQGAGVEGGGTLGWGSMATKKPDLGTGNCLEAKRKKKKTEQPAACEWDRKLLSDSDICLLAGAFSCHQHICICQFNSSEAATDQFLVPVQMLIYISFLFLCVCFLTQARNCSQLTARA